MKLTRSERRAVFNGDYRALRRPSKPGVKAGETRVLSWTRGGRQIVDRDTGATVEIPRKPTVWIEFKEPELRDGEWLIRYVPHDQREPLRLLGATPGPPSEAGLKTRWRPPSNVPARGEQHESWTPETERGYGSSGQRAIDHGEGVDDDTLRGYSADARARFAEHQELTRSQETAEKQSKQLMRKLRRLQSEAARYGIDVSPHVLQMIREMEREIARGRAA